MERLTLSALPVDEDWIASLQADATIQAWLKANQQKARLVAENPIEFDSFAQAQALCKHCSGLDHCQQPMRGFVSTLWLAEDESLVEGYRPCQYKVKDDKEKSYLKQYLHQDLSLAETKLSLKQLLVPPYSDSQSYVDMLKAITASIKKSKGLYIYGGPGLGKSYACKALANYYARHNRTVAFVNEPNVFADYTGMSFEAKDDLLANLRKAELLVFDDFGFERLTRFSLEAFLFPLLDYRMQHEKKTYFTSNFSLEQLEEGIGRINGIVDVQAVRILERIKTLASPILVEGKSFR